MTRTVAVGLVSPAIVFLPLWVAEAAGEFERRNLSIESTIIGSTDGTTSALVDGSIDVAFATPDAALEDPATTTVLVGLVDRPPLSMICRPELTSFEHLRGKGIGTSSLSEGTVHLITAMMRAHDLELGRDYDLVLAGAHPQRWEALKNGTLDAALQLMPYDDIAIGQGFVSLGRASDYVPEFAFSSATVRTDWLKDEADLGSELRDALVSGERLIRTDPAAAARIAAERTHLDESLALRCVRRMIDDQVMPADLVHSDSALAQSRIALREASARSDPEQTPR